MGCGMETEAQKVTAGGLMIYVDRDTFLKFVKLKETPIVVVGETWTFKKIKVSILPHEGALIIYRGEIEPLENCES